MYAVIAFFNPQIKIPKFRSRQYLDFISTKPCIRCGKRNPDGRNDPHHERSLGGGGTATKPDDTYAVPLDHECHVLRDMWKGPIFDHAYTEEAFYPPHVDVKMQIIKYLTDFLMERKNALRNKKKSM